MIQTKKKEDDERQVVGGKDKRNVDRSCPAEVVVVIIVDLVYMYIHQIYRV